MSERRYNEVVKILDASNPAINTTSAVTSCFTGNRVIQLSKTGTGTCTVVWYGSNTNDTTTGVIVATMDLFSANPDSAGAVVSGWSFLWCVVTASSGTFNLTATVGF